MESEQIKKNWDIIKRSFKRDFSNLKKEDLEYNEGCEDELIKKLVTKTGLSKEEIIYLMYVYNNKLNNH